MEKVTAVTALAALAQASRLDVFLLLVEAGKEGLPAGKIAERLGLPHPTLSFHLAQLKHAGLVTCRRMGRSLIYCANFEVMGELIGYLFNRCCHGAPEECFGECLPAKRSKRAAS